jgi:hypothetical protein
MIRETLEATRSQMIAALAVLDLALAEVAKQERAVCSHDQKVDVSTMGNPGAWYCPHCKETSVATTVA